MKQIIGIGAGIAGLIPSAGQAQAMDATQRAVSPFLSFGKVALALCVVLLVFWILARLGLVLQHRQGAGAGRLRILSSLAVGSREKIILLQVGEEQLLLGVCAQSVNLLHTLPEPLLDTTSTSAVSPASPGLPIPRAGSDFRKKLDAALRTRVKG